MGIPPSPRWGPTPSAARPHEDRRVEWPTMRRLRASATTATATPRSLATYLRFAAMIVTRMVVMYAVMFLGSWEWSHVRCSESRVFMALTMGGTMGLVMLVWMLKMYRNPKANVAVIAGVCELAVEISEAQRREILEMSRLIDDIQRNGAATNAEAARSRPVPHLRGGRARVRRRLTRQRQALP